MSLVPYIGVEATKGERVIANTIISGFSVEQASPEENIETFQSANAKYPAATGKGAGVATGSISGNACYRGLTYILAMACGITTTANGDGSYTHVGSFSKRQKDPNKTLSIQFGDSNYSLASKYAFLTELGLSVDANGGAFMELSGGYTAQNIVYDKIFHLNVAGAASGDTFLINVTTTDTTEPLSYAATDAQIKAALENLLNVTEVTVTSKVFDFTTPATVTSVTVVNDGTTGGTGVTVTYDALTGYTIALGGATGGTYRLRVLNTESTSALAYNATASAVQTALTSLECLADTDLTCTSGPLSTAPVMVELGGNWTATQFEYRTISFALNTTGIVTNGATASLSRLSPVVTEIQPVPITVGDNGDTDLMLAANLSELDNTTLNGKPFMPLVFACELSIGDLRAPTRQLERRRSSYISDMETQRSPTLSLTCGGGEVSDYIRRWKQGCGNNVFWARLESKTCRMITGTNRPFSLRVDMAVSVTSEGAMEENEGVAAKTFEFGIMEDPTQDYVVRFTLVNDVATL